MKSDKSTKKTAARMINRKLFSILWQFHTKDE